MIIDADWDGDEGRWDASLEPVRDPETGVESFDAWWHRCNSAVGHLHPMIAEQWIYRHWRETSYGYLPLEKLRWTTEQWRTVDIIREVYVKAATPRCPESDFRNFQTEEGEPIKSFYTFGTWNYPIVVIRTPDGVRIFERHIPDVRFCLIEGHKRLWTLKAWKGNAFTREQHEVFVLSLLP
jgi:hypothetical protein